MDYNKNIDLDLIIARALKEDIGKGDITTELITPKNKSIKAVLLVKDDCVVCGLGAAAFVFKKIDKKVRFRPLLSDGERAKKGAVLARLQGKAASILTAERAALNFLSLLSGVATKTRKYVDAIRPYKVKITDTRKTIPGLRELEKYAVKTGGGYNHRMRLDEMILIKDNHIKVIKSQGHNVTGLMMEIKKKIPKRMKVEIEVENLRQFKEALSINPDIIMLDNMSINDMKKAVLIKRNTQYPIRNTLLEASGGITLKNVRKIASTGVDMISVGALTHSVNSVDISLEFL